ncbi:hypothetical protein TRIUR3_00088 [Triticum urartu]|uniref:Uncharacterized protein n=1 Tax=Triticum urartu TaxID=4572 RepID=M7Y835_TRIUA|nr:hypothetical protein TRIUR3_00088 [Triticum urartu]
MCDDLRSLANIYDALEEIICLPSNQVCSAQQRSMLDGEMEGSLELLDLCSVMQEIFVEMKAIIQELQVALRKGDDATTQAKIQSYTRLVKKSKNLFKKTAKKAPADCSMVMLLAKAREISVSLLESTLRLLSKQIEMPKQSLVFKAFQKKKAVVCKEEQLSGLECRLTVVGARPNPNLPLHKAFVPLHIMILNTQRTIDALYASNFTKNKDADVGESVGMTKR